MQIPNFVFLTAANEAKIREMKGNAVIDQMNLKHKEDLEKLEKIRRNVSPELH